MDTPAPDTPAPRLDGQRQRRTPSTTPGRRPQFSILSMANDISVRLAAQVAERERACAMQPVPTVNEARSLDLSAMAVATQLRATPDSVQPAAGPNLFNRLELVPPADETERTPLVVSKESVRVDQAPAWIRFALSAASKGLSQVTATPPHTLSSRIERPVAKPEPIAAVEAPVATPVPAPVAAVAQEPRPISARKIDKTPITYPVTAVAPDRFKAPTAPGGVNLRVPTSAAIPKQRSRFAGLMLSAAGLLGSLGIGTGSQKSSESAPRATASDSATAGKQAVKAKAVATKAAPIVKPRDIISARPTPAAPHISYPDGARAALVSKFASAQAKATAWEKGDYEVEELSFVTPVPVDESSPIGVAKADDVMRKLFSQRNTIISMGEGIDPRVTSFRTGTGKKPKVSLWERVQRFLA